MKLRQFQSIKINSFTTGVYELPLHSHTYYELIYIFKGSGTHHINKSILKYKRGDLFLISPEDVHYFEVKESTEFMYIKFNDSFFDENTLLSSNLALSFSPKDIMKNAQLKEVKLQCSKPYNSILRKTFSSIREYNEQNDVTKSGMISFLVLSIFELIREAATEMQVKIKGMSSKEDDVISYIHQNIYFPELLKVEKIASEFNLSANYFSTYFSRNFGTSYNQYVTDYKLHIIEMRICSNVTSLKNISAEFGFTDLSHFNNFFKRNRQLSPTAYRELKKKKA